jgi:hypothetical protein
MSIHQNEGRVITWVAAPTLLGVTEMHALHTAVCQLGPRWIMTNH